MVKKTKGLSAFKALLAFIPAFGISGLFFWVLLGRDLTGFASSFMLILFGLVWALFPGPKQPLRQRGIRLKEEGNLAGFTILVTALFGVLYLAVFGLSSLVLVAVGEAHHSEASLTLIILSIVILLIGAYRANKAPQKK